MARWARGGIAVSFRAPPSELPTDVRALPTRRIAVVILSAFAFSGCAELPLLLGEARPTVTAPDPLAVRLAAELHPAVLELHPALDHPALQAYVAEVGQRLAKQTAWAQLDWRFTVLDTADVNAFALPGGYVYLTRGLLAYPNSEAELAGVIAHEIGHVIARHGVPSQNAALETGALLQTLAQDWVNGYGRERELEASQLGAEYLARAGYNPQALLDVMTALKQQAHYATEQARPSGQAPRVHHATLGLRPGRDARLRQAVEAADRHAVPLPRDGRNEYLQQLVGLAFGERPEGGVLRGNLLLHDGFGLALEFPLGWRVRHDAARAIATSPDGDAWVELMRGEGAPQDALHDALKFDEGVRFSNGMLSGYPAVFAAGAQAGRPLIAAAVTYRGTPYLLAGIARDAAAYARERNTLRGAINSFRALTTAEEQTMQPPGLGLTQARAGTSMAGLAQQSPLGADAETQLRLINGFYPKGEPKPGQLLKIVR